MYRGVLCESLCGLLFSALAWGQGLSTISGTISDPSGAMIPSAKVIVREVGTDLSRTATSGADGYYVISSLRPTNYALTVEAPGFRTLSQTGITLLADESVTMNLKLEIGATAETVKVEANVAQVDTTTPTLRQVVDSARMIELPLNGRNPAQLTTLVAGAVSAPSGNADQGTTKTFPGAVTVSVNGGRQNNIAFNIDGVHSEDIFSNVNQPLPMPDALQEFSFQTSNFSAEYGQNSSGVVNVVTKSGTNSFHGDGSVWLPAKRRVQRPKLFRSYARPIEAQPVRRRNRRPDRERQAVLLRRLPGHPHSQYAGRPQRFCAHRRQCRR